MREMIELSIFVLVLFAIIPILAKYAMPVFSSILKYIKKGKLGLIWTSMALGFLPVHERIYATSGVLKSMIDGHIFEFETEEEKRNAGILMYIWTHHFYLWSLMEKTILIPMTYFGLSYYHMLKINILPLIGYLIVGLIASVLLIPNEVEINVKPEEIPLEKKKNGFIMYGLLALTLIAMIKYGFLAFIIGGLLIFLMFIDDFDYREVRWKHALMLLLIVWIGFFIRTQIDVQQVAKSIQTSLPVALLLAFCIAFILGSSSRYSLVAVILTSVYGLKTLPLFLTFEFLGYLISPFHQCTLVPQFLFGCDRKKFYITASALGIASVIGGILTYLFVV